MNLKDWRLPYWSTMSTVWLIIVGTIVIVGIRLGANAEVIQREIVGATIAVAIWGTIIHVMLKTMRG